MPARGYKKPNAISRNPLYHTWRHMLVRCCDPTFPQYRDYGGRGIMICSRWLFSLDAFSSDMGPKPSRAHTLDRIDNDGNYEPGNCRWATRIQQNRNARSNRRITFHGITKTIGEWAIDLGLNYMTLYARIVTHNWPLDRALSPSVEPVGYRSWVPTNV